MNFKRLQKISKDYKRFQGIQSFQVENLKEYLNLYEVR